MKVKRDYLLDTDPALNIAKRVFAVLLVLVGFAWAQDLESTSQEGRLLGQSAEVCDRTLKFHEGC